MLLLFVLLVLLFALAKPQVPISSMFYEQLLCTQVTKAQKDSQVFSLFALSRSERVKAVHITLDKSTPGNCSSTALLQLHLGS